MSPQILGFRFLLLIIFFIAFNKMACEYSFMTLSFSCSRYSNYVANMSAKTCRKLSMTM